MKRISEFPQLAALAREIIDYGSQDLGMTLPEVRFFVLDPTEFMALLEKRVYPTSPPNIWEGKRMAAKKMRVAEGMESALYYEVVQTGNPSYAYLNDTNSTLTQASVMAHVLGHCEFSELNVLLDSDEDRTEYVMFLVRKVELARSQMGRQRYLDYWNACESMIPLIQPNSQYNLAYSVDEEHRRPVGSESDDGEVESRDLLKPYSSTLEEILHGDDQTTVRQAERKRARSEDLSLHGYRLRAPCQDVAGFLRRHAPASTAERSLLDYFYTAHLHQDFVIRTQIMNEGWAMYWEKKIMLELFSRRSVKGAIDYARVFSGVCFPRPYYQRNPYHLGYHLWQHIEQAHRTGKLTLAYVEETSREEKDRWNRPTATSATDYMRNLVGTITDFEFLRRYLTPDLVEQFKLNRIPKAHLAGLGLRESDVVRSDRHHVWVQPEPIPAQMLEFFTHYYQPRIFVIDNDFLDGGLLLMHRDDGRPLRQDWIKPTLANLNRIWKGPVYLLSQSSLHGFRGNSYEKRQVEPVAFDLVVERMGRGKRPLILA